MKRFKNNKEVSKEKIINWYEKLKDQLPNQTKSNIISVSGTSMFVYLTFGSIYTPIAESLSVTGTMKLMRIG